MDFPHIKQKIFSRKRAERSDMLTLQCQDFEGILRIWNLKSSQIKMLTIAFINKAKLLKYSWNTESYVGFQVDSRERESCFEVEIV